MTHLPPGDDLTPPGPLTEPAAEHPRTESREARRLADQWTHGRGPGTPDPYGRFPHHDEYEPPPSKTMAGWALGLSIAFCIPFGFLVAIGLAIAVLVRSRDGRDHGKGMAIAALIISALTIVANVVYIVVLVVDMWRNGWDETERDADGRVTESGLVSIDRLRVGDCVSEFQTVEDVKAGEWATGEATVVPCAEPHRAEVFEINRIDPSDYVDQPSLNKAAARGCMEPFREYVGRPFYRSIHQLIYYNPSVSGRAILKDTVVCLAAQPGEPKATMIGGSRR